MDSSKGDIADKDTVDLGVHQRVQEESSKMMAKSLLSTDQIFGPYKISRQIAKGAMGVVYLAEDMRLGRDVALKIILTMQGLHPSDEQVERFVREARSIAKVRHHAIVPVFEAGEIDGLHYFTMEYIHGSTLEKFLVDHEINAVQGVEIVKKIAEGLQAAHEKGVVHRDIKPANILMENGEQPMVTDFGLAKLSNQEQKLTMTGSMLGTPCYMSPEQARGDSDVDLQSDLFSLGIILYEIVCSKLPFKGDTYMKTVLKVIDGEYTPPRKISPRLSRDVENIIRKSLEKERIYRYKNAGELISDCDRFLRGEVVLISSSRIWRKWIRLLYNNASRIMLVTVFSALTLFLYYKGRELEKKNDLQKLAATQVETKLSKEKEEIKKKLDQAGEILKSGTTSPEFIERFAEPAQVANSWSIIGSEPLVETGKLTFKRNQATTMFPKLDTYPNSSLFEMKVDLTLDSKVRILAGHFVGDKANVLESPVLIELSKVLEQGKINDVKYNQIKIWSLKGELKDLEVVNLDEHLASLPLAMKRYVDTGSNLKTIRIKKFEAALEISFLSDDMLDEKPFRVSYLNFFRLGKMLWGVSVPETNEQSVVLTEVRVDKYFPGTEETEINSILDSVWSKDTKALRRRLLKYAETMQQAYDLATTRAEKDSLKYKSLKATLLASIVLHRFHFTKLDPDEFKELYTGYETVYNELATSYQSNGFDSIANSENRFYLLRFSLFQLAMLDYFKGENAEAVKRLKEYQGITGVSNIYEEILWFLPISIEAVLQKNLGWHLKKNNNYLDGILEIFSIFKLQVAEDDKTYVVDFIQSVMDAVLNSVDLQTMFKLHSITKDKTNLASMEKLFSVALGKSRDEELAFQVVQKIPEVFGISAADFLSNSEFMAWRYNGQKIKMNKSIEAMQSSVLGSIDDLGVALKNGVRGDFFELNKWMKDEGNLDEFLFSVQDLYLKAGHEKYNGEIHEVGDIFPVDVKIEQNQGGKINLQLTERGLVIKLQTWDRAFENPNSGKNLSTGDCWQFFFDFGPGIFFMHSLRNKGRLRIDYAPKANGDFSVVAYGDNKPISIDVLEHSYDNRIDCKDEIVLLVPISEIRRLAQNRKKILYFGFNGSLRLGGPEDLRFKKLHENSYALYRFDSGNLNLSIPEIKSHSLRDQILSFDLEDELKKKILVKNVFEDLFELPLSRSLMDSSALDSAVSSYYEKIKLDAKKMNQSSVIGSIKLIEDLQNKGLPFNLNGVYYQYSQLILYITDNVLKQKKGSKGYEDAISQLIETVIGFRGNLNWDVMKKETVRHLQGAYLNAIEVVHNLDADRFKQIRDFYDVMPDSAEYSREKGLISLLTHNYQSAMEYFRKANESRPFSLDTWIEYQYSVQFLGYLGYSTSYDAEWNREGFRLIKKQYNRIDADLILTIMGEMKVNEFLAKYPRSTDWLVLFKAMTNETSIDFDDQQVLKNYASIVKKIPNDFIKRLIQIRMEDLKK